MNNPPEAPRPFSWKAPLLAVIAIPLVMLLVVLTVVLIGDKFREKSPQTLPQTYHSGEPAKAEAQSPIQKRYVPSQDQTMEDLVRKERFKQEQEAAARLREKQEARLSEMIRQIAPKATQKQHDAMLKLFTTLNHDRMQVVLRAREEGKGWNDFLDSNRTVRVIDVLQSDVKLIPGLGIDEMKDAFDVVASMK